MNCLLKSEKLGTLIALLSITVIGQAGVARAENVPNDQGQTQATAETITSTLSKHMAVNYWGQFAGPSVGYMAGGQPTYFLSKQDGSVDDGNRPVLSSAVTVGYKLDPEYTLGAQINFDSYFIGNADIALRDPAIKLVKKKLINQGNFTMDGALSFYVPVDPASKAVNMWTKMRTTQNFNYDLPGGSRWSVGLLSYQYFSLNGDTTGTVKDLIVYAGPNLAYKINSKLSATFWYEMGAHHARGDNLGSWSTDGTDLQTGISWDITPHLNINPYIQTYPISNISLNSTTVGAYIVGSLL